MKYIPLYPIDLPIDLPITSIINYMIYPYDTAIDLPFFFFYITILQGGGSMAYTILYPISISHYIAFKKQTIWNIH